MTDAMSNLLHSLGSDSERDLDDHLLIAEAGHFKVDSEEIVVFRHRKILSEVEVACCPFRCQWYAAAAHQSRATT